MSAAVATPTVAQTTFSFKITADQLTGFSNRDRYKDIEITPTNSGGYSLLLQIHKNPYRPVYSIKNIRITRPLLEGVTPVGVTDGGYRSSVATYTQILISFDLLCNRDNLTFNSDTDEITLIVDNLRPHTAADDDGVHDKSLDDIALRCDKVLLKIGERVYTLTDLRFSGPEINKATCSVGSIGGYRRRKKTHRRHRMRKTRRSHKHRR